ncbi:HAD family phosphatase [Tardiphaga alba]|uniref:HAD family phosphatase n=1 Tax=Tardiphaga alba TaxID=340268 RepID=A0ABX8AA46_9BRAD|nr:HAD-IA family hydrolase [Tardiphaga alba]QUS40176.1 HAD family phosphatase [Tardiphaga alba]
MTSPSLPIDALLFDLGRVILDIDFDRVAQAWAYHAGQTPQALLARFTRGDIYMQHERGQISDDAFFAHLRETLAIELTPAQFLEGWNAIFVGEMPGIGELLPRAAARWPLYAFSNTNPAHVAHFSIAHANLLGHFREVFLSSSIGMRKPDAESFDHVVAKIGVPANRILFFDDSEENVTAARARGLQAVHVTTPHVVADTLASFGL